MLLDRIQACVVLFTARITCSRRNFSLHAQLHTYTKLSSVRFYKRIFKVILKIFFKRSVKSNLTLKINLKSALRLKRPILYAALDIVEKELDRFQQAELIKPKVFCVAISYCRCQESKWLSPYMCKLLCYINRDASENSLPVHFDALIFHLMQSSSAPAIFQ